MIIQKIDNTFAFSNVFTMEDMNQYLLNKNFVEEAFKAAEENPIMRTVYVNGEFIAEQDAKVSIFDRAFLFADGVYEVTSVLNGKLVDFDNHIKRLKKSMKELDFAPTINEEEFLSFHRKLVELNEIKEGIVYLQVSRGIAERDFAFPDSKTELTDYCIYSKKRFNR